MLLVAPLVVRVQWQHKLCWSEFVVGVLNSAMTKCVLGNGARHNAAHLGVKQ